MKHNEHLLETGNIVFYKMHIGIMNKYVLEPTSVVFTTKNLAYLDNGLIIKNKPIISKNKKNIYWKTKDKEIIYKTNDKHQKNSNEKNKTHI